MNKKLSKRLSACLNELSALSVIADIGTDHAYLPCQAVATGVIDKAIAIDVIDGPLAMAKQTITDYGLTEKIELRKGSGLESLKVGEVAGVCLAGMGGKLISQLLLASLPVAKSMQKLTMQPQGGELLLRKMLFENDFAIINEILLEEDGIIYTVMSATPQTSRTYDVCDLMFGPILRQNVKDALFVKKWRNELVAIDRILNKIPSSANQKQAFVQKKQLIEEVLLGVVS